MVTKEDEVTYGPGGLSKKRVWPILTGEKDNPEEDLVIGWAPAEWGKKGILRIKALRLPRETTTVEILNLCGNHGYSLKMMDGPEEEEQCPQ